MLMVVKNQCRVTFLTIKYALMREMLNKVSFFTNVILMILNNASFIIQWLVLYSLKENIGGYSFKQVLLLWGISSGTYGISRFFFKKSFDLSDTIVNGKLDAFLVQPKNVLISVITSDIETSAIGDLLYSYIIFFLVAFSFKNLILYTLFIILGGFVLAALAVIVGSLSFWFNNVEIVSNTYNSLMVNFSSYPDGIFKGFVKGLFYTLIPLGISTYVPIKVLTSFYLSGFIYVVLGAIIIISLAFIIFNIGLKRYSSSNLMSARI